MNAFAASGSPMSPRSITARAVCSPAPRNVSGAQPSGDAARGRELDERLALGELDAERLLAERRLARLERGPAHRQRARAAA